MSTRTNDPADPVGIESTRWSVDAAPSGIDHRRVGDRGRVPAPRHYAAVLAAEVMRLRRELRANTDLAQGAHAQWAGAADSEQGEDLDRIEACERAA